VATVLLGDQACAPGSAPESLLDELSQLEALRDPAKGELAQRQFDRFIIRADAELHPVSRNRLDSMPVEIKLRDVACGGIGFICERQLPIRTMWRVCFLHGGHVIDQQAIMIRHSRPMGDSIYLTGGQFVIETGLMSLLGVDAARLADVDGLEETSQQDDVRFVPPADVA
jgi:hypothetical protein